MNTLNQQLIKDQSTSPTTAETNAILESLGGAEPSTPKPVTSAKALSSQGSPGTTTDVAERALDLLGAGVQAEQVASALGVTPARIAQLLATEMFAEKVAELRYKNLQSHNIRDGKYDVLEDKLIQKLEYSLPLMIKPDTIMKALSAVNGAKRRGQSAPTQVTNQQNIVTLMLPSSIAQKFTIDINNQVTKAGEQELLTMPSGNLLQQVEDAEQSRLTQELPLGYTNEANETKNQSHTNHKGEATEEKS